MTDIIVPFLPGIRANSPNAAGTNAPAKPSPASSPKKKHASLPPFLRIVRNANSALQSWRDGLTESEREDRRRTDERKQILAVRMQHAKSMEEWETAAKELDSLEGNDQWKLDSSNSDYNPELIEEKLRELDEARTNCDIRTMMYLIRTTLSRDLGGMGNVDLYRHSYIGTKSLIERYVDSAIQTIEMLVDKSAFALPPDMEQKDLLEGVLYARQSFGRSALLLSGGGTFGMAHIGVLKAMFEAQLLPRIISGASAGSIVCSVLCTRKDDEIPAVLAAFPHGDLAVFESETDTVSDHIRRLLTEGSWADIKHLTRVMQGLLGDITFQEAYNRTRRICNICVSTESIYELPRLLNYITAPNVMIWSAVAASCSVPLIFNGAGLLVKDPATGAHVPWNPSPQRWIDGSVDNDLPMTRLAEMFNVNHFIVSQVNPHVVPFLPKDDRLYSSNDPNRPYPSGSSTQDNSSQWLNTLTSLAKDEALHRLHFLAELGIFPNLSTKLRSILSQKYSGDITILPEIVVQDLPKILKNPTAEFMERNCLIGEQATWPKLSRIKDRCAIELALDRAIHALRARVVFSKSQVDLRRLAVSSEQSGADIVSRGLGVKLVSQAPPIAADDGHDLAKGATAKDEPFRGRRNSGGSIQLLSRHRKMLQNLESVMTDEETEEEERLEMSHRRHGTQAQHAAGRSNVGKPRLKRSAKSQFHLSARAPLTTSVLPSASNGAVFDFSRPLTPPLGNAPDDSGLVIHDTPVDSAFTDSLCLPLPTPELPSSKKVTPHVAVLSPMESASEQEPQASDADIEDSRTEDSDPEPYQETRMREFEAADWGVEPRKGPTKTGHDIPVTRDEDRLSRPIAATGNSDAGLWD